MSKWVLVSEIENGGLWCEGLFDNYETALGKAMSEIFDERQHIVNGEYFEFSNPEELEGDGGYVISVLHQAKPDLPIWKEHYYLLIVEEEKTDAQV